MPKNKIGDLNNHLFSEIERLSDEDLKGNELEVEINRARAVTGVAKEIIAAGKLVLGAKKVALEYRLDGKADMPEMLGASSGKG